MEEEALVIGGIYQVHALDFSVAIWNGEHFKGPKREYGKLFFNLEQPYWNGLPFGTAKPVRLLTQHVILKPFDGKNLLHALDALNQVIMEMENDKNIN